MKKESVFRVAYHEFEALVNKEYNKTDYSIVADEELSNDSSKSYSVEKMELSKYDKLDLEKFKKGHQPYMSNILFQDLCNKGIIDEGEYIIDICW